MFKMKSVPTVGLIMLAVMIIVSVAEAAPPSSCKRLYSSGVTSCFDPNGDDIWVYDAAKDGYSARVRWNTNYSRSGTCTNSNGYGTWKKCDYDMKEGYTVRLRNYIVNLSGGGTEYYDGASKSYNISK